MKYGIGGDIGIASVGYAAVALDDEEKPCGIALMGSRIFDKAEQPKTGDSLAAPRREARSMRRRLRRHRHRIERIRELIVNEKILSPQQLERLYDAKSLEDIYALRTFALDNKLTNEQLARVLINLAQRRGFKSNRKADAADKEAGKLLQAVDANKQRMEQNGYRTVGEMMCKDAFFAEHKRNKGENYLSTVSRDMVVNEAVQIFNAQRKQGLDAATPELEAEYLDILTSQRSFDEGPGYGPYSGDLILSRVGVCTFENGTDNGQAPEKRAAKATWSFEYFSLLEKLNHIRIQQKDEQRPLTQNERDLAVAAALKSPDITYAKLRTALALDDAQHFNMVRYHTDKTVSECEKTKLNVMRAYHEMRKALDKVKKGRITELSRDTIDEIGTAFSLYKTDEKVLGALENADLDKLDKSALLLMNTTPFAKFGHLSVKACKKIIPHLEKGMNYNDACTAAGYDFNAHCGNKTMLLPYIQEEMSGITSPVVRRAVSQTIKVINAIIREMGESPTYVNIELARELSKNFDERNKMQKDMEANAANNERIVAAIRELGVLKPSGQDIVKYRLWNEQDGRCAYSLAPVSIARLFEPGYAEVDHIVPYSISFDDSRANKVLVLAAENRQKGNRLPMQYLTGKRRDDFVVWTNSNVKSYRKRQNLLKEGFKAEDENNFRERNLQDTKHMAAFLYNYINDHLKFAESSTDKKRRVNAVNGAITSHLRKRWGLTKTREDGDTHHAADAVVIACATNGMINTISRYYGHIEGEYMQSEDGTYSVHAKTKQAFPAPWPNFRLDLETRMGKNSKARLCGIEASQDGLPSVALCDMQMRGMLPSYDKLSLRLGEVHPIFVSRMPRRSVTGAAHKETIKGVTQIDGKQVVLIKTSLNKLKLDKNGEIAGYYNPTSDILLYNALKARLTAFGGNAEKAFEEKFYKPKSDGTQGPLVKKVKLYETPTLTVPVHGGTAVADNDTMVRIDVFHVENEGYYFVPIYIADTLKKVLPNRAVVAFKPAAEWKEMSDDNFIFSLYPNDLIKVKAKKDMKFSLVNAASTLDKELYADEIMCYYRGADISTASIGILNNDNVYKLRGLGIKTLVSLEKYQVDVLGNYTKVKQETRMSFNK